MQYSHSRLLDAEGCEVWEGPHDERLQAICELPLANGERDALLALGGASRRTDGSPWVAHGDVFRTSRDLGMVSTEGTARGFVLLPPPGALLERCVASFNREHRCDLAAVEMMLPTVFDHGSEVMQELTGSYAQDGRMFRLTEPKLDLRLSYAADPHLFNWLCGRELLARRLPYTIVTDVGVLRRFRSGEIGRLNRVREYRLPDVHSFVTAQAAQDQCVLMTSLAARATRFWAGESWAQVVDLTADFSRAHPDLPAEMARAARRPTIVNTFATKPRYYEMRSGLMPDAGTGPMMLYNLQWDEENPRRFGICLDTGEPLVILHGNLAAGSGILSLVLGRALAGLAPRVVPVEVAAAQVIVQPLTDRHRTSAEAHRARLEARGLRVRVSASDGPLGHALRRHEREWRPFVAVVGDRETDGPLHLQLPGGTERIDEERFFARYGERITRCCAMVPADVPPLPFAGAS